MKLFKLNLIFFIIILLIYIKYLNIIENKFYNNIRNVHNPSDIDVIINKNNKLNKKYKPNDLILLNHKYSNKNKFLRKEALINFEKLSVDASKKGFSIIAVSTYRSYIYQNELYNYYYKFKGKKYADKCCARPGHSEHQTGLAVDVMGSNNNYNEFDTSIEFNWMTENCYKYGFILRYPKGKEKITGFKYEPWHYRYVGKKLASYLHKNKITLEEYKNFE